MEETEASASESVRLKGPSTRPVCQGKQRLQTQEEEAVMASQQGDTKLRRPKVRLPEEGGQELQLVTEGTSV